MGEMSLQRKKMGLFFHSLGLLEHQENVAAAAAIENATTDEDGDVSMDA